MISFSGRGLLLDVEGTTSSVRYVYEVLFPYARMELLPYLQNSWNGDETCQAFDLIAIDAGAESFQGWTQGESREQSQAKVITQVTEWMEGDVKATGLKALQGLIWRKGFESGELRAHVYEDVPAALLRWNAAELDVRIFSSGSIAAQKLFFAHTDHGNLLPLLHGHYDTTTGPKRVAASYTTIAAAFEMPPSEILFLSDIVAELDAAREAGMQTGLMLRPENGHIDHPHDHPTAQTFDEIITSLVLG